jgi:hypothetical protein
MFAVLSNPFMYAGSWATAYFLNEGSSLSSIYDHPAKVHGAQHINFGRSLECSRTWRGFEP